MPFYEYECSACKYYVEALQKVADTPLRKCPSCGKETLQRLISAPVFRLKGSGWYETDFKSDQEAKRNLADGKEPETKDAEKDQQATPRVSKALVKAKAKTKTKVKPATKVAQSRSAPPRSKAVKQTIKKPAAKKAAKKIARKVTKKTAKKPPRRVAKSKVARKK